MKKYVMKSECWPRFYQHIGSNDDKKIFHVGTRRIEFDYDDYPDDGIELLEEIQEQVIRFLDIYEIGKYVILGFTLTGSDMILPAAVIETWEKDNPEDFECDREKNNPGDSVSSDPASHNSAVLRDLISLVMETPPSATQIEKWTPDQKNQAAKWARAEYDSANDNPVHRKEKPSFLP